MRMGQWGGAVGIVLAFALGGCGGGESGVSEDGTGAAESTAAGSDAGMDDGAEACAGLDLAPGDHGFTVQSGDGERAYLLHVPPAGEQGQALPLIVDMHGYTSNAAGQRTLSRLEPLGDTEGFVVLTPEGLDSSWNGGDCCGDSMMRDVDDVRFVREAVADASARTCVDGNRVYATGMSNGGFMSFRLACEASDLFAAVASVTGTMGLSDEACNPGRPVPVLSIHGTDDSIVPYDGGACSRPAPWRRVSGVGCAATDVSRSPR